MNKLSMLGVSTLAWYKILGLWSTTNMTLILVSSYGSMYRNKCVVYWAQTLLTLGVTQKWDLWVPCIVHRTHKTDKKLKSQRLLVTIHMNSSHCPLIECAAAGDKKKKGEETWTQTQKLDPNLSLQRGTKFWVYDQQRIWH